MPPRDNGKMPVLRWPSFRRPLDVLFLVACILLPLAQDITQETASPLNERELATLMRLLSKLT